MQQTTKNTIINAVSKTLDEIDDTMANIEVSFKALKEQTQEYSRPHLENLRTQREALSSELRKLADSSEEAYESVAQQVDEYADSFMGAFRGLENSAKQKDNGEPGWLTVVPPTVQLGHPSPGLVAEAEASLAQAKIVEPDNDAEGDEVDAGAVDAGIDADRRYREDAQNYARDDGQVKRAAQAAAKQSAVDSAKAEAEGLARRANA